MKLSIFSFLFLISVISQAQSPQSRLGLISTLYEIKLNSESIALEYMHSQKANEYVQEVLYLYQNVKAQSDKLIAECIADGVLIDNNNFCRLNDLIIRNTLVQLDGREFINIKNNNLLDSYLDLMETYIKLEGFTPKQKSIFHDIKLSPPARRAILSDTITTPIPTYRREHVQNLLYSMSLESILNLSKKEVFKIKQ